MIAPQRLYDFLQKAGVDFYTGVPDSLLKNFLKYIQDHAAADQHIITANEGLAIGLASGYHLATKKVPLVYLQNSGLGNIVNPLTSLADKEIYGIPLLLLIGWRGKPGTKDEPQHIKMGRITTSMLEAMEIPYYELVEDEEKSFAIIESAIADAVTNQSPVALLAKDGLFDKYEGSIDVYQYNLQRENVIADIIGKLNGDETVVCTTGKIGRSFYEQNLKAGRKIANYFLCVGAMGHAGHIALGLSQQAKRRVIFLDGDGALLMHLGSLATMGQSASYQLIHIVINNGSHESVGGQPTSAFAIDLCTMAKACGYQQTHLITDENKLANWQIEDAAKGGPFFIEIRTNSNARKDLGRPAGTPQQWKKDFMNSFKKSE